MRAVAQRDVVRLRAGEVLHRGAEALARHEPQVGLEAAPEQHARLRVAVREDALDQLVAREGVHQRRRRAGGEDVEVAAGLAAAAQAADDVDLGRRARARAARRRGRARSRAPRPSAGGRRDARRSSSALRMSASFFAPMPFMLADAGRRAPRASSSLERADAELAVEQRHGLRADALQVQQVEDGRRELLQQFLVVRRCCRSRPARRSSRRGPCRCPGCASRSAGGSSAIASPTCAIVSAALRYARILNGFSPLISSRSPISARTRAMARLSSAHRRCSDVSRDSGRQAVDAGFDHAALRSRCWKSRSRAPAPASAWRIAGTSVRLAEAEQAAAAAGAADLAAERAGRRAPRRACASISGVVTPGASRLRFSHSAAICRPTSASRAVRAPSRIAAAMSRMRAKLRWTSRSPSMWRLVTSQLLMPELRDALV